MYKNKSVDVYTCIENVQNKSQFIFHSEIKYLNASAADGI